MDIAEISDRMEIEKLVTDYATAVDTKNFQEFNNLFTKDAHIDYTEVGGISGNLQEIIKYLETALDHFPNYQHLISNISLTLNGNLASGKVMCFNPMQTEDEQVFFSGCGIKILIKRSMINGLLHQELKKVLGLTMSPALSTPNLKNDIGLTGGIGSGKSAAANFFQNEGITVIDADGLSKEVIEEGTPGFANVVDYFGSKIINSDGSINRAHLRKEVFDDDNKKSY